MRLCQPYVNASKLAMNLSICITAFILQVTIFAICGLGRACDMANDDTCMRTGTWKAIPDLQELEEYQVAASTVFQAILVFEFCSKPFLCHSPRDTLRLYFFSSYHTLYPSIRCMGWSLFQQVYSASVSP